MARGNLNETVSVSFHSFEKGERLDSGKFNPKKFTPEEFCALIKNIVDQPQPDLKNPHDLDGVKFGRLIPFHSLEKVHDHTFFGVFRSAYWGHSFENSRKGKIDADSLNLRDFCFLLYLSDSGLIYLGCQYLGNYGDYGSLSKAIAVFLGLGKNLETSSIFSDSEDFKDTIPTEVRITLSSQNKNIAGASVFGAGSLVAFKKENKDDTTFEVTIKDRLLSLIGRPHAEIKKQVAAMLNRSEIYSVRDSDISNCVVTVRKKKSRSTKSVYLFGLNSRATRFHIDVRLNDDGLPIVELAKNAMIAKLDEEIIKKVMDD